MLHSPKARARPTADAVSAHLRDVRIRATDLLDDRTAVPSPERVNEYPAHRHDWPAQVPQAERDVDGRRMTSAWERLSTLEPDGGTAARHPRVRGGVVRSGGTRRTPRAWLRLMPMPNAGLTAIGTDQYGERTLELFNATDHLP